MRPARVLVVMLLLSLCGQAQEKSEGPITSEPLQGISLDEIVQKFTANETALKQAWETYSYRQTVAVQTLQGDRVDGEFQQVTEITFDDRARRTEKTIVPVKNTLQRVVMSSQDVEDIRRTMPFTLMTDEVPDYKIKYVGQGRLDDLNTYVLDVSPKRMKNGRRYFEGRIWVAQQDFHVVMSRGKSVPEGKIGKQENLSPRFTSWREQVDGKYWFPAYTKADDFLPFTAGKVHIRETIKYTDYKSWVQPGTPKP